MTTCKKDIDGTIPYNIKMEFKYGGECQLDSSDLGESLVAGFVKIFVHLRVLQNTAKVFNQWTAVGSAKLPSSKYLIDWLVVYLFCKNILYLLRCCDVSNRQIPECWSGNSSPLQNTKQFWKKLTQIFLIRSSDSGISRLTELSVTEDSALITRDSCYNKTRALPLWSRS